MMTYLDDQPCHRCGNRLRYRRNSRCFGCSKEVVNQFRQYGFTDMSEITEELREVFSSGGYTIDKEPCHRCGFPKLRKRSRRRRYPLECYVCDHNLDGVDTGAPAT